MKRQNRSMPDSVIIPVLAYRDVAEAVAWLCDNFGFVERLRIGNHRAQLLFDGGAMIVGQRPASELRTDIEQIHSIMVRVRNADEHHAHAAQRGARILRPVADFPYGERQYTAEDLGGHVWTFSQTIADVNPASWGGLLLESRSKNSDAG
jgi:uncharacterized glyoxalase superfamily protein PhnB